MARMVFGQWTIYSAERQPTHYVARMDGTVKTACGRPGNLRRLDASKDPRMVTCKQCRKALAKQAAAAAPIKMFWDVQPHEEEIWGPDVR